MKPETVVKIVGGVGTVLGLVGTLATNWYSKKEMDATITKKVAEIVKEELNKG